MNIIKKMAALLLVMVLIAGLLQTSVFAVKPARKVYILTDTETSETGEKDEDSTTVDDFKKITFLQQGQFGWQWRPWQPWYPWYRWQGTVNLLLNYS